MPPPNLCGHRRPVGRYWTGQMNKQTAEGQGGVRGTPMVPAPTPDQVPAPGGHQGHQARLRSSMDGEGGEPGTPKPLAQRPEGTARPA